MFQNINIMAIGKIKVKSQANSLTSNMLICNIYTPSIYLQVLIMAQTFI